MSTVHVEAQGLASACCLPNKQLVDEQVSMWAAYKVTSGKFSFREEGPRFFREGAVRVSWAPLPSRAAQEVLRCEE